MTRFLLLYSFLFLTCYLQAQDYGSFFLVKDTKLLTPVYENAVPVCNCEDLINLKLENTVIESAVVNTVDNSCRVTAVVNHPPAKDRVTVYLALPIKNWNGRFYGLGGGGFMSGIPQFVGVPIPQGFAASVTDAGHVGGSGSFALDTVEHRLRWQEIRDFAYQGIHDMTVTGKELVKAFYGKPAGYSYFIGGSTGGRQGMMEVQRFPEDYNGVMSYFPAINWSQLLVAGLWPQAVMNNENNWVSKTKLEAVTKAAIDACDAEDQEVDGVIADPVRCTWDPSQFVGTAVGNEVFTEADARVVRRIWEGARTHDGKFLWYGMTRGTRLTDLTGTGGTPLRGVPFEISHEWIKYFLLLNPKYNINALTWAEFEQLFNQSVDQYAQVIGTANPDLSAFKNHGGKVMIIHGLADQLVAPQGTIEYYKKVQTLMGGPETTATFARLFLVPGTDHALTGAGASPTGQIDDLIRWVEQGKAPEAINTMQKDKTGKIIRTGRISMYGK